jgi:hypothetical protein
MVIAAPLPAAAKSFGGQGGQLSPSLDPASQTSDTRILGQAVRQGWRLPEGIMERLPAAMFAVVTGKRTSHRNKIAAARVLVAMHGQNQADNPTPQRYSHEGFIDVRALRAQLMADNEELRRFGSGPGP